MKKMFSHIFLLSLECGVLLGIVTVALCNGLTAKSWAYSPRHEDLSFTFADGQAALLEKIRWCRVYYATYDDNELSERQKVDDTNRCFVVGSCHRFNLPPRVTQIRIDFYSTDKTHSFENPPVLEDVQLGDRPISLSELKPFFEDRLLFPGYFYTIEPFMNGWWRVIIPIAGLIWLVALIGGWYYFVRTTLCDE